MSGRWDRERPLWQRLLPFIITACCALLLLICVPDMLNSKAAEEQLSLISGGIQQAAVQCYALEGFYPPSLDYLTDHYGVQIDNNRYFVDYQYIAANLLPEITVIPVS